jgi:hypothetical protein
MAIRSCLTQTVDYRSLIISAINQIDEKSMFEKKVGFLTFCLLTFSVHPNEPDIFQLIFEKSLETDCYHHVMELGKLSGIMQDEDNIISKVPLKYSHKIGELQKII